MARGVPLPPRGSVKSAVLEEMVHRERVRQWKISEMNILTQAFMASGNTKLFEQIGAYASSIMSMSLHTPGAYDLKEKPTAEVDVRKTDAEYLRMLDDLPSIDG